MRLVKFTTSRENEAVWINPEMVTRVHAVYANTSAATTMIVLGDGVVNVRESVQVVVEALTNIVTMQSALN